MNYLQPLQYQSMFVPSNIDLMNQQIMARDQEYNQNEAMMAASMDKYAQMPSHASTVEYKNQLLGGLENDMNTMIDNVGGDIGALDKRSIVNKINSIRPEIQDIQKYSQLAEEQRKAMSVAGMDLQKDIGSYNQWRDSDKSGHRVGKIADYQSYLDKNYGDLGKRMNDSGLYESTADGRFLVNDRTRGLYEGQVEEYRNKMIGDLMLSVDKGGMGASEGVANQLAEAKVQQLVQGTTFNYRQDPNAGGSGGGSGTNGGGSPYTVYKDQVSIDKKSKDAADKFFELNEISKLYDPDAPKGEGDSFSQVDDTTIDPSIEYQKRYDKAIAPYKDSRTYKDMVARGATPLEAAKYMTSELANKYASVSTLYSPTDPSTIIPKVRKDLITNSGNIDGVISIDGEDKDEIKSSDFKEVIGSQTIESTDFNLADGTIRMTTKDKKGNFSHYDVPTENIKDDAMKQGLKSFKLMLDAIYSPSAQEDVALKLPNGDSYVFTSDYNEKNKSYDKSLSFITKDEKGNDIRVNFDKDNPGSFDRAMQHFGDYAARAVIDGYGRQVEYQTRKRK